MSNKQNIFQKIKRWTKFPRRKKHNLDTTDPSLLTKGVIKNQELMPIYKKVDTPLKSILKNNLNKENSSATIKQTKSKENLEKEITKINMGDSKLGSEVNKKLDKNTEIDKKISDNTDKKSSNLLEKNEYQQNNKKKSRSNNFAMDVDTDLTGDLGSISDTSLYSLNDNSHISLKREVSDTYKTIHRLSTKEDTFSMMDLFQKDNSFINKRKTAIHLFEKHKKTKNFNSGKRKKKLRILSDNVNLMVNNKDTFNVIMDNTLEKYSSNCCLDVSSLFSEERGQKKKNPKKRKNTKSDTMFQSTPEVISSSVLASDESSLPCCSGSIPNADKIPVKKKRT